MGIDPSSAGKLLTKPIIEKIEVEAKLLHFIKETNKNSKLPVD